MVLEKEHLEKEREQYREKLWAYIAKKEVPRIAKVFSQARHTILTNNKKVCTNWSGLVCGGQYVNRSLPALTVDCTHLSQGLSTVLIGPLGIAWFIYTHTHTHSVMHFDMYFVHV